MNKKKWKRKFAYRDSRRWLKTHKPFYSDLHGKPKDYLDVKDLIYEYLDMEREYKEYKHQQAYRINRGKDLGDVLEPPRSDRWRGMIAIREAKAITAHRMQRGHTALKLMHMMYWPKKGQAPMTLMEAGRILDLSWHKATTLHDGFLRLVEERYNLRRKDVW